MLDAQLPDVDVTEWQRLYARCRILHLRLRLATLPTGAPNRTRVATASIMHAGDYIAAVHLHPAGVTANLALELDRAALLLDREIDAWLRHRGIGGAA